jgi:amino acid adenylation domain-containing protein
MYKDLAGERAFAATQYAKEKEYWLNKLSGELEKVSFPPDILVPGDTERKLAAVSFRFSQDIFERLMTISSGSDSHLHMLLVTGLTLLLYKYTGHTDIIIGTPIDKQEVEGDFINTILALRNQLDENMTVRDLLMKVRQTVIEAIENQNYPLEIIPYELDIPVVDGDFPLFDTAVLLQNIQDKKYIQINNLNMLFSFLNTGKSLEGEVEYNASSYEEATIRRIVNHFLFLVQGAFNRVDQKLVDVPLLSGEEKNELLVHFNDTGSDYPHHKMIQQLFEEQAAKIPGNIAVQFYDQTITYETLNQRANQLARLLRGKGIEAERVAAIMLGSSIEVPVTIMAVLKAGGAYLPMGFEFPEERIDYLLKDSETLVLLTREALVKGMHIGCPTIDMEDKRIYTGDSENLPPINGVNNLAYIIYTSGTTGQPKGVMVEHRGLVNYIWWAAKTYVKGEKLTFPLYTSISFDLTVTSIFTPLITGNTIMVYGGVDKKFYIQDVIADNQVGVVKLTPSHLKLIRQEQWKNSSIKRLIVGGEDLETQLIRDIYPNFAGGIEIYNEYGPTETVVGSMIYRFNPDTDHRHSVPIGVPIANTQIYLLNSHHQPVPVGVAGELYISGDSVSRGYSHNPALTEEKFIANPFIPGQKMYKTGDLAIRLPNGIIEYKGRIDQQVKVRGYRVETGEIEARIVDFQKMSHTRREQRENVVEKLDLKSIPMCKTCLIPVNYPGGIHFDEQGVCDICREFETYKDKALNYFKITADFYKVVEKAQKSKRSKYDCLMLYSGGKDSSYVLHNLVEKGLTVLAFTFDNGYISETSWENIARTTSLLKVDHIVLKSEAMKEIFVESLWSDYNVCNGCFKAVNTLGTKVAHDHNINLVISGLTRGQIFDIKLHGLFKLGAFDDEEIEERLKLFRQNYHSMTHRTSRLIGVEITPEMLENIYFVDYYRYDNISTSEIFEYLKQKDQEWSRPTDTGSSSSNCIINDVGIYVHLKDKGCHFYSAQVSWDCRLGTYTREEGVEEITGYKTDYARTYNVLNEIGYYNAFTGAVVTDIKDERGEKVLCAYILADKEFNVPELKEYLSTVLPDYMIPTFFTRIDKIPLTTSGKVDRKALPAPDLNLKENYVAPRDEVEKKLAEVWSEVLGLKKDSIGIDINFFEVGGHSLRATFLAASINKEFNVKLPLVKIFESPTIRGLAQYVMEEAEEQLFVSISPAKPKDYYALSSIQSRLFILQQMDLESTAYNVFTVVQMEGHLEETKLENAFKELLGRHESLRTSFEIIEGIPVQKVHPLSSVDFSVATFEVDSENTAAINDILENFIRVFDLSQPPLIRMGLVKIGSQKYILMADMHHIITDGIAQNILIEDFIALYNGVQLPPLVLQYKDYSEWQQSEPVKKMLRQQEEYWLQKFAAEIPVLEIPIDYYRPQFQSFAGASVDFGINLEQINALNQLARSEGVTLFMTLIAGFFIFLSKISNQEDITVGTPIIGRRHVDLQRIIGIFVNTIVLRGQPVGEKTFKTFLQEIKGQTLADFENQDYPFEDLVEKVEVWRDISRNPLFNVLFVMHNLSSVGEAPGKEMKGLRVRDYPLDNKTSKFDLSLFAFEEGSRLSFSFEYCTKLFKEETILRFISYFRKMISTILESPQMTISDLEILTGEEKKRILYEFNDKRMEYPAEKVIHQLFAEQVERSQDAVALIFEREQLSYGELNRKANQMACYLRARGAKPDDIIGLMAERSNEMVIGMLSILIAGSAYLSIDSELPAERKKYMLENSVVKMLLTNYSLEIEGDFGLGALELINIRDRDINRAESTKPDLINQPSDLLYVIYTSGSTGKPKGVMLEHRNLVNLLSYSFAFTNLDFSSVLQFANLSFDISFQEIFSTLLSGGILCLIDKEKRVDLPRLCETILKNQIKTLFLPMSMLKIIFNDEGYMDIFPRCVSHICTAGEQVVINDTFRNFLQTNRVYLHNHYGPAEAHVVTMLTLEPTGEIPRLPSIGKPIANTFIYILDKYRHMLPIGVAGELCVGGIAVGRGYVGDNVLNEGKFMANPFVEGSRLYRTGDLARWRMDENIEFLGRMDFQVKIRGFRIELEEIEKQLTDHHDIKDAVVICQVDEKSDKYICAYIVSDKEFTNSQLREYLLGKLPDYMLPSYFIQLERLPQTPSGKIDRKALPRPKIEPSQEYVAPQDNVEKKLVVIWSDILGIASSTIGIDDNFFVIGGHSLKATLMIGRIYKEFHVKFPLIEVFKTPVIKAMAEYIRKAAKEKNVSLEVMEKKQYYPVSSQQKRLFILQQGHLNSIVYNRPNAYISAIELDKERLEVTLRKLIQRHESLRTSFDMINGETIQRVHSDVPFAIEYADGDIIQEPIENFIRPFDLSVAPLLRVRIAKTGEGHNILLVDIHHIISDGFSDLLLVSDFMALYHGGQPPVLKFRYKDFSHWQTRLLKSGEMKKQENYWLETFAGEVPKLAIPRDYENAIEQSFEGSEIYFEVGHKETGQLNELARREGTTLFMLLLASYNVLLAKLSGQEDIVVGTGIAGRRHADFEKIIGMFVNTLALRNYPAKEKTFKDFLHEVKERTLQAFENQDYLFENLVEKIVTKSDPGRNPLFDTAFVMQNMEIGTDDTVDTRDAENKTPQPGLLLRPYGIEKKKSIFDIAVFCEETGGKLEIGVTFGTTVFKKETIEKYFGYYRDILSFVIENKELRFKLEDIRLASGLKTIESALIQDETGDFGFEE